MRAVIVACIASGIAAIAAAACKGDCEEQLNCEPFVSNVASVNGSGGAGAVGGGNPTAGNAGHGGAGAAPPLVVAPGREHTCARLGDGRLWCWGSDNCGQLGNGSPPSGSCDLTTNPPSADSPVVVQGVPEAVSVSTSHFGHTCATRPDGTARCWGKNDDGQLGDGTTNLGNQPVVVSGLSGAIAISAGQYTTCSLLDDGTVRCWGLGMDGQLGNGVNASSSVPVQVLSIATAIELGAGGRFACALLGDGSARCWGRNAQGQLGNSDTANSNVPVDVVDVADAIDLSAGMAHACVVRRDTTVWCWGSNKFGQLGNGMMGPTVTSPVPIQVQSLANVVAVDAGGQSTCALKSDGSAWCWGRNQGQLGNQSIADSAVPVQVSNIDDFEQVYAGTYHSCGVRSDDTIFCWGRNNRGQLGNGELTNSVVPVQVEFP